MGGNGQVDLLAKHTQNRRGREGGGRVSWAMEEAGNSLPRNFSYRALGPPPGRTSPPAYVAEWAGTRTLCQSRLYHPSHMTTVRIWLLLVLVLFPAGRLNTLIMYFILY